MPQQVAPNEAEDTTRLAGAPQRTGGVDEENPPCVRGTSGRKRNT